MRYFGCGALRAGLTLWSLALISGCGHLPSEMGSKPRTSKVAPPEAAAEVVIHTASCSARARGYRLVAFDELYEFTDNPQQPFQRTTSAPTQYDVRAYVWGYDNCLEKGTCQHGDHYWLINRGPGNDFPTWVVTPQYPRITIESRCRDHLKVGERYRFSFKNGKLVGVSKN